MKICFLDFVTKSSLSQHWDLIHVDTVYEYKCTECNVKKGNVYDLRRHLVATHRVPKTEVGKIRFQRTEKVNSMYKSPKGARGPRGYLKRKLMGNVIDMGIIGQR